ncbi:hypothetical protein [Pseudomonas sp. DG56-2]|uniref:hypothetical protein n=1 Tax=Pseudomonas sp. DG56-2 TaxID=2320270 RepID=UPI0010A65BF0|nr:hypothetical protein [Pseudomonas sp. DG56-2]
MKRSILFLAVVSTFFLHSVNAEYLVKIPLESSLFAKVVEPPIEDDEPILLATENWTIDENIQPWLSGNPNGIPQIVQSKNFSGVIPDIQISIPYDDKIDRTTKIKVNGLVCSPEKTYYDQHGVNVIFFWCQNTIMIPFDTPVGASVKAEFYDK